MHLSSGQTTNRVKANKTAVEHYEKFRPFYLKCAQSARTMTAEYKEIEWNMESRVALTATLILQVDPHIHALVTPYINASDLAEAFARFSVGHETAL